MKRSLLPYAGALGSAFAAALVAGLLATATPARADIDVRVNIGNAPPAPRLIFRVRPHERYYPDQRVYVVDDPGAGDNDCFRYGGFYWLFRDGYWYRAPRWRDRFVVVEPRFVPAEIYRLPAARWKHHASGPPGLAKKGNGGMPPGLAKKGEGGPPGQMKKQDRKDHGDHGNH